MPVLRPMPEYGPLRAAMPDRLPGQLFLNKRYALRLIQSYWKAATLKHLYIHTARRKSKEVT